MGGGGISVEGSRWRDCHRHRDRPRGHDGWQQPARLRILPPDRGAAAAFLQ